MLRKRLIPSLLIKNSKLVKTIKFKNPSYVGDPLNAIRIFNEKEVDEIIVFYRQNCFRVFYAFMLWRWD